MSAATIAVLAAAFGVGSACVAGAARVRTGARALGSAASRVTERDLADAFIFIDSRQLLRASAVLAVMTAAIAFAVRGGLVICAAAALVALVGPRIALRLLRVRRRDRLVAQLPDAMRALAALLRAGHGLGQGLASLADSQPRPLRDEWRLLLRRLRMGERAETVFESLPSRIDAPEARLLAATIRVSIDLGAGMAEALDKLAESTRRRLEMEQRIRALTSQGRMQGLIVGALPLLLMAVFAVMDGPAMRLLWTTPQGWAALVLLVALELTGFLMIRRIVRIDV